MMKKIARGEILDTRYSSTRLTSEELVPRYASLDHPKITDDGWLYVKVRAISSRVNKNGDSWPSDELAKSYKSFEGRPIFVDHNNDDPSRTRGVVLSSILHVDDEKTAALDPYYATAPPEHLPPTWIELLLEIDAKTFPKLAKAIVNRDIDSVSMGADIQESHCNICQNIAKTSSDFCDHINDKGNEFEVTSSDGETSRRISAEICRGVNFFEISCFAPEAPVLMGDGSVRPISSIAIGDEVIDHEGNPQTVTEVFIRPFVGELLKISRAGYSRKLPLEATPEHPILAIRDSSLGTSDKAIERRRNRLERNLRRGEAKFEFVRASELQVKDWLVEIIPTYSPYLKTLEVGDYSSYADAAETVSVPVRVGANGAITCASCDKSIPSWRKFCDRRCYGNWLRENNATNARGKGKQIPSSLPLDEKFGRWCGWYLAEGNLSYNADRSTTHSSGARFPAHTVFTLGTHESDYIAEILDLGLTLFGIKGWQSFNEENTATQIHFGNRALAEMMSHFGTGALEKRLPDELMHAPMGFLKGIVDAHECGDGHFNPNSTSLGRRSHRTSSIKLADQLYQIHMWMGRMPYRTTQISKASVYRGQVIQSDVPSNVICWNSNRSNKPNGRIQYGEMILSRITDIDRRPYEGDVYNLEVENTHTYVVNGTAVHNCVFDPADETALIQEIGKQSKTASDVYDWADEDPTGEFSPAIGEEGHEQAPVRQNEEEQVYQWRLEQLERAGFPESLAQQLAQRNDVDWHRLVNVVGQGATPQQAYDIYSKTARDYSEEERKEMAKSGEAMKDGSFPIKDAEDLEHAKHLVGQADDPEAARAHINRRAKDLGLPGLGEEKKDKKSALAGSTLATLAALGFNYDEDPIWLKKADIGGGDYPLNDQSEREINYTPQSELETAPQEVNTLRADARCPQCSSEMELDKTVGSDVCPECGFSQPPSGFDNPDLSLHERIDPQLSDGTDGVEKLDQGPAPAAGAPNGEVVSPEQEPQQSPINSVNPVNAISKSLSHPVIDDMRFTITNRFVESAASDNKVILTDKDKKTDAPKDTKIVSDALAPVEAQRQVIEAVRKTLADHGIELTDLNKEAEMEKETDREVIKRVEEDGQGVKRTEEIVKEFGPMADGSEEEAAEDTAADNQTEESAPEEESTPEAETETTPSSETEEEPKWSSEQKLFAALKLAKLASEIGLISAADELTFVGEIEDESMEQIEARMDTLSRVREAGIARKRTPLTSRRASFPSLPKVAASSLVDDDTPFEALFL